MEKMSTSARYLQVVLNFVKQWYIQAFIDRLVYGQLAIEDRNNYLIGYVSKYCSKPQLECNLRGSLHAHCLVWHLPRVLAADDDGRIDRLEINNAGENTFLRSIIWPTDW